MKTRFVFLCIFCCINCKVFADPSMYFSGVSVDITSLGFTGEFHLCEASVSNTTGNSITGAGNGIVGNANNGGTGEITNLEINFDSLFYDAEINLKFCYNKIGEGTGGFTGLTSMK